MKELFKLRCEVCSEAAMVVIGEASAQARAKEHHQETGHTVRVQSVLSEAERMIGAND